MTSQLRTSLVLGATILAIACTPAPVQQTPAPSPTRPAPSVPSPTVAQTTAVATIRDTAGKTVGTATLIDTYAGVLITGSVSDLGLGAHGVHIHTVGKCDAPLFTTAGGHFNPAGKQHGFRNANGHHLGDMPNLDTPAAGVLKFEVLLAGVTLKGQNALLDADGAAIVVHAARDDYTTDPSGNSGGRIACGVITQR